MNPEFSRALIAALAAVLVGFSKTGVPGLGILIVPLMALVFPAKLSVGALLPMLVMGDIAGVGRLRQPRPGQEPVPREVAWFFLIVNVSKLPIFGVLGMITGATLRFDVLMLPLIALGGVAGYYAQARIPQRAFNALVIILAIVAALRLVW